MHAHAHIHMHMHLRTCPRICTYIRTHICIHTKHSADPYVLIFIKDSDEDVDQTQVKKTQHVKPTDEGLYVCVCLSVSATVSVCLLCVCVFVSVSVCLCG